MPNPVVHFAIAADDVERARQFYTSVFAWEFSAWGPPGFYLIEGAGIKGALQQRDGPNEAGAHGFECTIAVADVEAVSATIVAAGGELLGEPFTIPTIGTLAKFRDTERNMAIVMQYTPEAAAEMGLKL
ncbi:MAG: VOC family protein [Pseudomonadota bacterium]